ncbi:uncharacterized protein Z518_07905 [Rhinocladiella mackenziei CBS 650.93]|uniref:DUF1254 domain-containing protein n=1 Tax=Rhinocladiella mackenziei CBS 650.93 TaxID=1442369 RepID=A0A0D2IFB7_9EURO|nr:uncharacterized protein Z518_07905 [Rhinocladiella mackenziei CBS 650.93]KIX01966.1 hypothetical protein Z518_07905 [Rhinocladiella mackenziei CBS 650.93]
MDATTFALVYGYPLVAYEKLATAITSVAGINNFRHYRTLKMPEHRMVVRTNCDTLYSTCILDLSHNDVILTIPELDPNQFALFSFYDPYGDNIANLRGGGFNNPGQYRIRLRPTSTDQYGIDHNDVEEPYQAYINLPTIHGVLSIRWGVKAFDVETVQRCQDMVQLEMVSHSDGATHAPTVQQVLETVGASTGSTAYPTTPEWILELLAKFAPFNGPELVSEKGRVGYMLSEAGISNGTYNTPQSTVDLAGAYKAALDCIAKSYAAPGVVQTLNNGWTRTASQYSGDYGTNYGIRAIIAETGYLMLKSPLAFYPSWGDPADGMTDSLSGYTLPLGPREAYIYDFVGGKPPIVAPGFWSLTCYDEMGYLIFNQENVYCLGNQHKLTYPDGTLVYGGEDKADTEPRSFQLLIQPVDVPPPAKWKSNWIPAPRGGGRISPMLRFFNASEELEKGHYTYPIVRKQAAIPAD